MVIVDTNIIIDHIRQNPSVASYLTKLLENFAPSEIALSVITIQELYVGKSTRFEEKEKGLLKAIDHFKILPYSYDIACFAGKIVRDSHEHVVFADAAIAATAIIHKSPLFTLNTKDFQNIKNLKLYK